MACYLCHGGQTTTTGKQRDSVEREDEQRPLGLQEKSPGTCEIRQSESLGRREKDGLHVRNALHIFSLHLILLFASPDTIQR